MQFKKQLFFLFLLVNFKALGQVTTQELFPNAENEITIIVDLKKAKDSRATGLLGKSSDVYLWSGAGATETFTIRKMSGNVGVERIIPVNSPFIDSITVVKRGAVRRARIFYFRERTGKSARIREKKNFSH